MLNCLTYIAFVYWAVATVHTVLPIDVGLCGADPSRGGLGALLHHTFGGGRVALDFAAWTGYPCQSHLVHKILFILQRPGPTVRHIMSGGGQNELFVPILFIVPLAFLATVLSRQLLGWRLMSDAAARTMLKLGVAVGCRGMIILQSLQDPTKQSLYFKRYSKVEMFIVAWTAYIIELPVWHEALVSGGTLACILLMCTLFPQHFLPEVNPWNVAVQGIIATIFGIAHASYQQRRRRMRERAARAAASRSAGRPPGGGKAGSAEALPPTGKEVYDDVTHDPYEYEYGTDVAGGSTSGTGTVTATTTTTTTTAAAAATTAVTEAPVQLEAGAAAARATTEAEGASAEPPLPPPSVNADAERDSCAAAAAADAAATAAAAAATAATAAAAGSARASAVGSSLEVLRRINACGRLRPYVSPARPFRFAIKVQQAHLADLPANLLSVLNDEVLVGSGWQAVSAYAREGCVELVLDLRPLLPTRTPYPYGGGSGGNGAFGGGSGAGGAADGGDDRRGMSDQDCDKDCGDAGGGAADGGGSDGASGVVLDEATLRELSRSVVSYLHSSGVLQPDREPSVVLQLGDRTATLVWQVATQTWEFQGGSEGSGGGGGGGGSAGADARHVTHGSAAVGLEAPPGLSAVPALEGLSPRLAVWPGTKAPLRLVAAVRGPSAEEILVGGGLVVRHGGRLLPYSVVRVSGQAPPPPKAGRQDVTAAAAAAVVAVPPPPPPLLLVELAVSDVPPSGLLRVEARTSAGLLSAPLAVVVDFDSDLLRGLDILLNGMDAASADAVLTDFGSWMDAAAAAVSAFRAGGGSDASAGAGGGKDTAAAAAAATAAAAAAASEKDVVMTPSAPLDVKVPNTAATNNNALSVSRSVLLAGLAGPIAAATSSKPCTQLHDFDQPDQPRYHAAAPGAATAAAAAARHVGAPPAAAPPALHDSLMVVAADLLALCCQGSGADAAVGAVADRLLTMVAACDPRGPAAAVAALLAAVPSPPTNAGALHLAVAAGSRPVVAVLLRWQELLYGNSSGGGGTGDLWLSRAMCGVTPLHVAAAMADGGAMAGWALDRYPAAAAAWRTATSSDGLTPASLAAQLGGRWRLRLWHASPVVQAARRALTLPAPLRAAGELLWGFDDRVRERRFAADVSGQVVTALFLYTAANVLAPLLAVAKAVLYGGTSEYGGICSRTLLLSALAFHVPHTVPLLAWLCSRATKPELCFAAAGSIATIGTGGGNRPAAAPPAAATPVDSLYAPASGPYRPAAAAAFGSGNRRPRRRRGVGSGGGITGFCGCSGGGFGLRRAVVIMDVCRAAAKAAAGLAALQLALPQDTSRFLCRGGDIVLDALVRPLVEQVDLPCRLLLSLLDAPATYLLYRGVVGSHHPGTVLRPLERLAMYQAILLGTTAAVSATQRLLFLRAEEARVAWLQQEATNNNTDRSNTRPASATTRTPSSPPSSAGGTATPASSASPPPLALSSSPAAHHHPQPRPGNGSAAAASGSGGGAVSRPAGRKSDDQSSSRGSNPAGGAASAAGAAAAAGDDAGFGFPSDTAAGTTGQGPAAAAAVGGAGGVHSSGGSSSSSGSGCGGDLWPRHKSVLPSSAGVH